MSLVAGTFIGPYEIIGWIGAGGMGEVYRARDARLGRDVAIKLIAAKFAADGSRLRRFEQEARAVGQINHPNILAVYDVGEHEGAPYIVSELLEGESLRSRLTSGPLSPRKAVDYARQMAEGIAAAHDKGIVHRDLKPDNLFITSSGRLKILDFGIAKLATPADEGARMTGAPTETAAGMVIGTAGYMSPEQVRGETVDARSDLFSFGAVLYEMLTGRTAFIRPTGAETLAAVLKEDPPAPLPANISPALERIVSRCLEKTREARFQSARDLAFGLEYLSGETATAPAVAVAPPRRWRTALIVGVVVLSLIAAAASWLTRDTVSLDDLWAHAKFTPLTSWDSSELDADISPDGKSYVFITDRDGPFRVFLGQVDAEGFNQLTPDMASQKNPGPNRSVGFSINPSEIWVNGTTGRRMRRISSLDHVSHPFLADDTVNVAWSHDGKRLVYFTFPPEERDRLVVADGTGGNPQPIFESKGYHNHFPTWSMDDQWIYFTHGTIARESEFDVWRIPSGGGTPEPVIQLKTDVRYLTLFDARTMLYVAPDEDGSGPWLWALDLQRKVTHRLNSGLEKYQSVAASANGHRLVATLARSAVGLWSVPIPNRDLVAEERDVQPYPPQAVRALAPRFGGGTLFFLSDSGPGDGLWRLQDGKPVNIWRGADGVLLDPPAISEKDGRVVIVLKTKGRRHLEQVFGDGATHKPLAAEIAVQGAAAWSPDAKWIAVGGKDDQGPGLFIIPVDPVDGAKPIRLVSGPAFDPVWSPTEDLIVYSGGQNANSALRAVRMDKQAVDLGAPQVPSGGGGRARFLQNGNLIYVQGEAGKQDFWLLDRTTGKSRQITRLSSPASVFAFDITADGRQIVFDRVRDQSDIRLIDLPIK